MSSFNDNGGGANSEESTAALSKKDSQSLLNDESPCTFSEVDIEKLLSMGFAKDESIQALDAVRGSVSSAASLLISKSRLLNSSFARFRQDFKKVLLFDHTRSSRISPKEKKDDNDWVNYLDSKYNIVKEATAKHGGPLNSKILIRIGSYEVKRDDTVFVLTATFDGNQCWNVTKTYSELLNFKMKLPFFGSHLQLKIPHHFPLPSLTKLSPAKQEKRRRDLENWFRGLCLSEYCTNNEAILIELSQLLGCDMQGLNFRDLSPQTRTKSLDFRPKNFKSFQKIPSFKVDMSAFKVMQPDMNAQPRNVTAATAIADMPFQYHLDEEISKYLQDIFSFNATGSNKDNSFHQLERDYDGDRIVIQGNRVLGGGDVTVSSLVEIMKDALQFTLDNRYNITGVNFCTETVSDFCINILRAMSRTQSAAISYFLLRRHLGQVDSPTSPANSPRPSCNPESPILEPTLLIVPNSGLCMPIEIQFSLEERSLTASETKEVQAIEAMYAARRVSIKKQLSPRNSKEGDVNDYDNDDDDLDFYSTYEGSNVGDYLQSFGASDAGALLDGSIEGSSNPPANQTDITSLAEASNLFHVTQKHPNHLNWMVRCEAQASGVYRLMDSETLRSVGLIKITYKRTFFGKPTSFLSNLSSSSLTSSSSSSPSPTAPSESSGPEPSRSSMALFSWSVEPCDDSPAASSVSFESLDLNKLQTK